MKWRNKTVIDFYKIFMKDVYLFFINKINFLKFKYDFKFKIKMVLNYFILFNYRANTLNISILFILFHYY